MFVRVSETYDLSTVVDKMGLVSIHTPDLSLIKKMWGGLLQNYRYMRFDRCDVTMACASMLPADPLQIGTEAGDIAPQDMFNPILYTAVSNDSYNTLINRITALSGLQASQPGETDVNKNSVSSANDITFQTPGESALETVDQFQLYYALLADPDGWRKSMPQSGLSMDGLYPIVFSLVSNFGNTIGAGKGSVGADFPYQADSDGTSLLNDVASFFRGPSMRMPRFPTVSTPGATNVPDPQFGAVRNGDPGVTGGKAWEPPTAYVAAIVLPPAKLNRLYYRMRVTWTIELTEPRPLTEIVSWKDMANIGAQSYGTDYVEQSSMMTVRTSAVDASGATVTKVMEAGR